jgi:hypothetical protein
MHTKTAANLVKGDVLADRVGRAVATVHSVDHQDGRVFVVLDDPIVAERFSTMHYRPVDVVRLIEDENTVMTED